MRLSLLWKMIFLFCVVQTPFALGEECPDSLPLDQVPTGTTFESKATLQMDEDTIQTTRGENLSNDLSKNKYWAYTPSWPRKENRIVREYIPTELFEEVAHLTFASTAARDPKAFRKGFIPPFVCQSEMTTPGASVITFDRYCPLQMIVTTHPTIGGHSSMMTLGNLKRIFGKSFSIRADCTDRPNSPGISERRSKPSSIGENTPVAKPVKKADSSKVAN